MTDFDSRIRSALSGLREAPVPEAPRGLPARDERPRFALALGVAAVMLAVLVTTLSLVPRNGTRPEERVARRIAALEARISALEHQELRELMRREVALLRRELELATSSP